MGRKPSKKKHLERNKKDFNEVKSEKNINKYDFKILIFLLNVTQTFLEMIGKYKKWSDYISQNLLERTSLQIL